MDSDSADEWGLIQTTVQNAQKKCTALLCTGTRVFWLYTWICNFNDQGDYTSGELYTFL